jgi:hypothetical protein
VLLRGDTHPGGEKSNNIKEGLATGNGRGIAIKTNGDMAEMAQAAGVSLNTMSAISILHGAGHNTTPINNVPGGHLNTGIMSEADQVKGTLRAGGVKHLTKISNKDNQTYFNAIRDRHGKDPAKDNYGSNKASGKTSIVKK